MDAKDAEVSIGGKRIKGLGSKYPCEFCGSDYFCTCPVPGTYAYAWRKFAESLGDLRDALIKAYRIDDVLNFLTSLLKRKH